MRKWLRRTFGITGLALDIKELATIFGGSSLMTALGSAAIWFFTNLPLPIQILAGVGGFLLIFALIRKLVLIIGRIEIPNRSQLLSAIAKYETKCRDYFTLMDSMAGEEYLKASAELNEQELISGLSRERGNPISVLTIFASLHLAQKRGGNQSLGQLEFVGKLRDKAERAITWVHATTK